MYYYRQRRSSTTFIYDKQTALRGLINDLKIQW